MTGDTGDVWIVWSSVPDQNVAGQIADRLVTEGLAACVHVTPVGTSVYAWNGVVQRDSEHLLMIKTHQDRYAQVASVVRAMHPYELPEIIAVPVVQGLPGYLAWVRSATAGMTGHE